MPDSIERLTRLLPQWMALRETTSLGYKYLNIVAEFLDEYSDDSDYSAAGRYITISKLSTPWLGYLIHLNLKDHKRYTLQRELPVGLIDNPQIISAKDLHDFFSSKEPIAYFDEPTNTVFFNNLLVVEETFTGVDLATTPTGSTYVEFNIGREIMAGTFVRYRQSSTDDWLMIEPYSGIDYTAGTVRVLASSLTDPSGTTYIQYSYKPTYPSTPLGGTNIYVSTSETTPLQYEAIKHPIWNYFDDLGILVGVERLPDEDNYLLRARIINALRAPGNSTYEGLMAGVGRGVALSSTYEWTGRDTIDVGESDFVFVQNLREIETVEREPMIEGRMSTTPSSRTNIWYTQRPVYGDSYEIWINGRRYYDGTLTTEPSGESTTPANIWAKRSYIDLSSYQDVSGILTVECTYSYRAWSSVTSVTPGNTVLVPHYLNVRPSDNPYYVTSVNNLTINRLFDTIFIASELMATTPTNKYYYYADRSLDLAPVVLGKARWGDGVWFSKSGIHPQIGHLPSNWDITQAARRPSEDPYEAEDKQVWKPGVGGKEDLKVKLIKLETGTIYPALHYGYYFIGKMRPIEEFYLFATQETTPIYINEPSTPLTVSFSNITPVQGAPIFIQQSDHELQQHSILPETYHTEVHTVAEYSGYGAYTMGCPLYHSKASTVGVLVAIYSDGEWLADAGPSDYSIMNGTLLFTEDSLPSVAVGDVIRVKYWTEDSFAIARDADTQEFSGRTLSIKSSREGTHRIFTEGGWPSSTPGLEAYRHVTPLDIHPFRSGARAGFLYITDDEGDPSIVRLGAPFSADSITTTPATTPTIVRRPKQLYSSYHTVTPSLSYSSNLSVVARVLDDKGNPMEGEEVMWSVGSTTPTIYSSTTDRDGISILIVDTDLVDGTPISASCGSIVAGASISKEWAAGDVDWFDEYQVTLVADKSTVDNNKYYLSAWVHQGGKPITTGTIYLESRQYSITEEHPWRLLPISTTPVGPLQIPATPTWTVSATYSPHGEEEIRAGYYIESGTPGWRYSKPIIVKEDMKFRTR